jgi:transcriptional regulator with GAF, ATPase, and Fis domain
MRARISKEESMSDTTGDVDWHDPNDKPERMIKLAKIFVSLADTLVEDYDVSELLARLVSASLDVLDAKEAGVLLLDDHGDLQVMASSTDQILEIFRIQRDEGPSQECLRSGTSVSIANLVCEAERWPRFCAAALEGGFSSVQALPLRLRQETVGALNVFFAQPRTSRDTDLRISQSLADVATIGILQQRAVHRSALLADQLQRALSSRIVIEQAKGVLAEHAKLTMDLAFAALRKHARDHNLKLSELAAAISRGDVAPDDIVGSVPTPS